MYKRKRTKRKKNIIHKEIYYTSVYIFYVKLNTDDITTL